MIISHSPLWSTLNLVDMDCMAARLINSRDMFGHADQNRPIYGADQVWKERTSRSIVLNDALKHVAPIGELRIVERFIVDLIRHNH